jgi:hypothetical protein
VTMYGLASTPDRGRADAAIAITARLSTAIMPNG